MASSHGITRIFAACLTPAHARRHRPERAQSRFDYSAIFRIFTDYSTIYAQKTARNVVKYFGKIGGTAVKTQNVAL